MSTKSNFMDKFKTPKDYLLYQISQNKGTQSCIFKSELVTLAENNGIKVKDEWDKKQIAKELLKTMPVSQLAKCCEHFGVSSYSFQAKYDITNADVKLLAKAKFLIITGKEKYRSEGKEFYAPLYSVFQYYNLTKEEVHAKLTVLKSTSIQNKGER